MSNLLLISGSPRRGNTDYVLHQIAEAFNVLNIILLRDKSIHPCSGCLHCHLRPGCAIHDDMDELYEKMTDADLIVLGTPCYFDNVSGLTKTFIDRMNPLYRAGNLRGKKLLLSMVGGGTVDGTEYYLRQTTAGFVKYLGLDLIGVFTFQALQVSEVKQSLDFKENIQRMIQLISEKI